MNFLRRIRQFFRRRQLDEEMREEMALHLELQTAHHHASGMNATEARQAAEREFGNLTSIQQRARDSLPGRWLDHWSRDFRISLRSLRRSPGFTLAVAATLGLCIGANTTVLSVLYGLILRPMPFRDAEQLVEVYTSFAKSTPSKRPTSIAQYIDYKANADLFDGFALWKAWSFTLENEADPERGVGARVTADYFSLLGVQPLLGRFYTTEECVSGRDKVVVLTQTYWENKFGAAPDVVGRVIQLGGEKFTIVGIAPRSVEALNGDTSLFKPFEWTAREAAPGARNALSPIMYGRIKKGVAHAAALAQLLTLEDRYREKEAPAAVRDFLQRSAARMALGQVRTEQTKAVRSSLWLLQVASGFVLLLGCANVASLMLARLNTRGAEFAVRRALGAGRGALTRELFVEGLLLAGLGTVLGVALTWASLRVVNSYTTAAVREAQPIALDGVVLGLSVATTLLVAWMIALLPIASTWRAEVVAAMAGGSRGFSARGWTRGIGGLLATAQVALALVLLVGAGLLWRSLVRVLAVDPGFESHRVVQGRTVFGGPADTSQALANKHAAILARMAEIPGVERVAYTNGFPIAAVTSTTSFPIRGAPPGSHDTLPIAAVLQVSPGYFEVMGIRLIEGRTFTEDDLRWLPRRAFIVDENFARRYFPGRSAVGESFSWRTDTVPREEWPTIVGVVAATKLGGLEDASGVPFAFVPASPVPALSLLLRTERPAAEIVPLMREKLRGVDSAAPLYLTGSLAENLESWLLTNRRGVSLLLGIFAATALLLSVVGIYGLLAYDVAQRRREIGIRGALGASPGQVVALILRQGLARAVFGSGLGLLGALGLTRYLRAFLFGVDPVDPATFGVVSAGVLLVSMLACWLPARRAAKIDPAAALRTE